MTQDTPTTERVDPGAVHGRVVLVVALATAAVMALGVLLAWELQAGARVTGTSTARFGSPPSDRNGIEMALFERHRDGNSTRGAREPAPRQVAPAERALVAGSSPHGEPERELGARGPAGADRSVSDAAHRLQSYGWNDRARGRVFIPITRAIDLIVEREGSGGAAP